MITKTVRLLLPVSFLLSIASPGFSQGISEGMGMMGMPKPVPGVNAGMYDKLFTAPHRATERAISQSGTPAPSAKAKSKSAKSGGAKPTGAAITSGDVNMDPQAQARAQIVKQGQIAQDLYKKAQDAETKGKLPDAIKFYGGSLAIKERYWPKSDKTIPEIFHKLAVLNTQVGDPQAAIKAYDKERYYITQVYGPGTKHSIAPARSLGELYQKQGDLAKSQDFYKQALTLTERDLGKDSKEAMELRLIVARQAKEKDWNREAAGFYQTVVDVTNEHADLVPTSDLVVVLNEYADVLKKLDRTDEADSILAQADKLKGGGSPEAAPPTAK
jgi:hypothetical protein